MKVTVCTHDTRGTGHSWFTWALCADLMLFIKEKTRSHSEVSIAKRSRKAAKRTTVRVLVTLDTRLDKHVSPEIITRVHFRDTRPGDERISFLSSNH